MYRSDSDLGAKMDAKRFKDWQKRMGWNAATTATRLGRSPDTISTYRIHGVPAQQATVVGLAMAALENGLRPV